MSRRPAAVVFDNDGLLLDTEEAWTRAEVTLFARRDRTFDSAHKHRLLGSSAATAAGLLEEMLEEPGRGAAIMDELHVLVMEEALRGVNPRPGALDLLERLRAAGVPIGLASNSQRPFVERVLSGVDLLEDGPFAVIVTADDVEHPKPAPDVYLRACAQLGADPASAIALEDSPPGATAAKAAGLYCIGVPFLPGQELPGVDLLADSLADAAVHAALGVAD